MFKTIADWYRRNETIRELSALSDHELADLGISRVDIRSVVAQARMSRDDIAAVVAPRQTLSRLGAEKTATVTESFA